MKDSHNQFDENEFIDEEKIIKEISADPALEHVKAPKGMKDSVMKKIQEHERAAVYDRLSEEDKEAMRLGKELLARRNAGENAEDSGLGKAFTSKKGRLKKKAYVFVAAAVVMLMACGVTCMGGPKHMSQMVDEMFAGRNQVNMDSGKDDIKTTNNDEEEFYQNVTDEFGFEPVRLLYKPIGMDFSDAQVDGDMQTAYISYLYNGKNINYTIVVDYRRSSLKFDIEDPLLEEYTVSLDETDVQIKKYFIEDSKEIECYAQFFYKDNKYIIMGIIDPKDFEDIIKHLKFL